MTEKKINPLVRLARGARKLLLDERTHFVALDAHGGNEVRLVEGQEYKVVTQFLIQGDALSSRRTYHSTKFTMREADDLYGGIISVPARVLRALKDGKAMQVMWIEDMDGNRPHLI